MTHEFEEYYKRFCETVDSALTLYPGKEWYAVSGEEVYDPDIRLDCGDDSSVRVYTDEEGHMVFKPTGKEGEEEMSDKLEEIQIRLSVPEWAQENGEMQRLRRMASDIDAEIACLEGLDDWRADELARQDKIRKRAIMKRIQDLTEGEP